MEGLGEGWVGAVEGDGMCDEPFVEVRMRVLKELRRHPLPLGRANSLSLANWRRSLGPQKRDDVAVIINEGGDDGDRTVAIVSVLRSHH